MFRFTIRDVLWLTAFVAVGVAALKYAGNWWWWAVASGAWLMLIAAAIVAAVDRGRRQAAALGFVIGFAIFRARVLLPNEPSPTVEIAWNLFGQPASSQFEAMPRRGMFAA